jgi:hypothetical protein
MEELPTYYYGRKWDAPLTDDAIEANPEFLKALLDARESICDLCREPMTADQNLLLTPYMVGHTECHVRSGVGDVQHLEKRCLCYRGSGNEIVKDSDNVSYRESALAAVVWLIDHRQGRFHD